MTNYLKKGVCLILCAVLMGISGCSKPEKVKQNVTLSVWTNSNALGSFEKMIEDFKDRYSDEANFNILTSIEGEITCKETVLSDIEGAADVYVFADDQFQELWKNGALHEVTLDKDKIIEQAGGSNAEAIKAVTRDGKLYGYPETAGNGYFLYYNSKYFTEDDVKDLDKILDICAKNDKKFSMDFTSGWYTYSFFKGAGLELGINADGDSNYCNWNSTTGKYKGTDVVEAMLKIAANKGFINCDDTGFLANVENGSVIAGVSGMWNAENIKKVYGDNYAACKLPVYTIKDNEKLQMCSFSGYKIVGVNAYSDEAEWAQRLAEWLTNEENQITRFRAVGECPANVNAAASEEVQSSPAVAAFVEQSKYSTIQSVADNFWEASCILGTTIAAGNPDNVPLQELLDTMVGDACKPTAKNGDGN